MKKVFKTKTATALLGLLLILSLTAGSCVFIQGPAYKVELTEDGSEYHIEYDWSYGGQRWRYESFIPVAVYDHFVGEERAKDYREYVYNEMDDDWLQYTANKFRETVNAEEEEWEDIDTINFVMSFVQNLPYEEDPVTTGLTEYPRYPIESMIDCGIGEGAKGVDCEDTVVLLVSILQQLGFEVALLLYPDDEHMAAGVRLTPKVVNEWDGYALTLHEQDGKIWAYCETTFPGWLLGQKHPDIQGEGSVIELD